MISKTLLYEIVRAETQQMVSRVLAALKERGVKVVDVKRSGNRWVVTLEDGTPITVWIDSYL